MAISCIILSTAQYCLKDVYKRQVSMNTLKAYLTEIPVITNRDAENMGIGRHTLSALASQGKLERIRPGVYQKTGEIVDDFILISSNSKRIVFSHQTALYLHKMCIRDRHCSMNQKRNLIK